MQARCPKKDIMRESRLQGGINSTINCVYSFTPNTITTDILHVSLIGCKICMATIRSMLMSDNNERIFQTEFGCE